MLFWKMPLDNQQPSWLAAEASFCKQYSLPAPLTCPTTVDLSAYKNNPTLGHSLRIWVQFRKKCGLVLMPLSAPIDQNHYFPPSLQDLAFKIWKTKGIKYFGDLYIDGTFHSPS